MSVVASRNFDLMRKNTCSCIRDTKNDVVHGHGKFAQVGKQSMLADAPFAEICERKIMAIPLCLSPLNVTATCI